MTQGLSLSRYLRRFGRAFPSGFRGRLQWQYGGAVVAVLSGFIYTIIVARYLGVAEFGVIALALGLSTLGMQPFHANMRDFTIRYCTDGLRNNRFDSIAAAATFGLSINICLMGLYFTVILFSARLIADLLDQPPEFANVLVLATLTPILQIGLTDSLTGVLRALNHVRDIAIIISAVSILRLTATWVGLEFYELGVRDVLLLSAASLAAGTASYLVMVASRLSVNSLLKIRVSSLREFYRSHRPTSFIRRNYLINLLSIPTKDLDITVLGIFGTVEGVGVYRVAKSFMNAIWAVTDPFHLVIYPELAHLWHSKSWQRIRLLLRRLVIGLLATSVIIMTTSYVAAPFIIEVFVGPDYGTSSELFLIMITSTVIWLPLLWIHPLFLASGRNELSLYAAAIHSIVSSLVFLILGYSAAELGIAIAYSFSLALIGLLQLLFLRSSRLLSHRGIGSSSAK